MKNIIFNSIKCTTICFVLMISSCSSPVGSSETEICDQLEVVAAEFIDAAVLYGQDPSVENCKAYKSAIEEYVGLIDDCSFTLGTGIQQAQETIDDLDC